MHPEWNEDINKPAAAFTEAERVANELLGSRTLGTGLLRVDKYCGSDTTQAEADISWAVANGEVSLGYVFKHPEPSTIFRPDPAATRAASPSDQPAETAPASPS